MRWSTQVVTGYQACTVRPPASDARLRCPLQPHGVVQSRMATLKLPRKSAAPSSTEPTRRKPVRHAALKRPTLSQAQAERAARAEEERRRPPRPSGDATRSTGRDSKREGPRDASRTGTRDARPPRPPRTGETGAAAPRPRHRPEGDERGTTASHTRSKPRSDTRADARSDSRSAERTGGRKAPPDQRPRPPREARTDAPSERRPPRPAGSDRRPPTDSRTQAPRSRRDEAPAARRAPPRDAAPAAGERRPPSSQRARPPRPDASAERRPPRRDSAEAPATARRARPAANDERPPRPRRSEAPPQRDRDARGAASRDKPSRAGTGADRRDAAPRPRKDTAPRTNRPAASAERRPAERGTERPPQRRSDRPTDRSADRSSDRPPRPRSNAAAPPPRKGPAPEGARRTPAPTGEARKPRTARVAPGTNTDDDDDLVITSAHAEGERLSKRMTSLGLSSRREADDWIAAGRVRVDGKVAILGQRVQPDARIEIDAVARGQQARLVTILLNKPVGYVSGQAEDGYQNAATLVRPDSQWSGDNSGIAFQRSHLRSLAPAGRLDIDSTGLLVLTQDGRTAKLLIGEDGKVEKEYLVRVENTAPYPLDSVDLSLLQHGLELDGEPLKPAKVSWQNEDQLRFVLREGKKRQIRRMCEAVGLKVLGLKRVRIGSVALGPLPVGQWRYLGPGERFA